MKRIISLFLLLSMLCASMCTFTACKEDYDAEDEATTEAEGDGTAFSTVRKQDYDGYTVNLLYHDGNDGLAQDFVAEKLNGSVLNDGVYKKNQMVSEALNIQLNVIPITSGSNIDALEVLRSNHMSGGEAYDICGITRTVIQLSYEGVLYNLNDLEDLNLSKEWWDQDWVESMMINDSIYTLIGDFSVSSLRAVSVMCFNKKLFDDLSLEYPYQAVKDGKWTYDMLLEYIKGYSQDLNENTSYDAADQFGIVGWGVEASHSVFYGSGFSFAGTNNEGELEISYDANRAQSIYEKIYRIWISENNYINMTSKAEQHSIPWDTFMDNRSLFLDTTLFKIGVFLGDMEEAYGILPQPKFSEDQETYNSYTAYTIPLTCVPAAVQNPEMIGNIVEAYCTASYDVVTPDIFEIVTKYQDARDPESAEMVDIAIRNKFFDPAHWYILNGYHNFARALLTAKMSTTASFLKSQTYGADKQVNTINQAFKQMASK